MTMMSKEHDVAKSSISPLLFMTLEGEPMTFFLRPGPIKVKLQPLITAGGGDLCRVQQPGAILLMDPTEEGSINETTAHWYVLRGQTVMSCCLTTSYELLAAAKFCLYTVLYTHIFADFFFNPEKQDRAFLMSQ